MLSNQSSDSTCFKFKPCYVSFTQTFIASLIISPKLFEEKTKTPCDKLWDRIKSWGAEQKFANFERKLSKQKTNHY